MDKVDLGEIIKEYLKDNLTVEVNLDCDEDVEDTIFIEGEKIDSDYAHTGCTFQKID